MSATATTFAGLKTSMSLAKKLSSRTAGNGHEVGADNRHSRGTAQERDENEVAGERDGAIQGVEPDQPVDIASH